MSETPPAAATPIDYRVEIENGALRLRLEIATKSISVPISGEQAALLGRALLAASVRLAVAPDLQGRGIGTQLLFAVLPFLPDDTQEIWVFTGQDSAHNIALYEKHGYEHQYDRTAGDLTYAYLRKILGDGEPQEDSQEQEQEDQATASS